jgi:hypothetical protein
MEDLMEKANLQIKVMVELVRGTITDKQRTQVGTLIILSVHSLQIIKNMVKCKVDTL